VLGAFAWMTLMVQDLTNPMLAQIPHVLLAAHAGTIMGVESNAMQFYPDASLPEARVHPGIFRRSRGALDLHTLTGADLVIDWQRSIATCQLRTRRSKEPDLLLAPLLAEFKLCKGNGVKKGRDAA